VDDAVQSETASLVTSWSWNLMITVGRPPLYPPTGYKGIAQWERAELKTARPGFESRSDNSRAAATLSSYRL